MPAHAEGEAAPGARASSLGGGHQVSDRNSPGHRAAARHQAGLEHGRHGDYTSAARCFEQAVAIDDRNAGYLANLGEAYRRLGQAGRAVDAFARAASLAPDLAAARFGLANALKDLGRFDEAIAHYKATVSLDPSHARAFYNLGNTLLAVGRFRTAAACFEAAVALVPDFPEAHNNLGVAHKELGELDTAIPCFRRALTWRPGYADAHRNLAQVLEQQGDVAAAGVSYDRVLAIDPADDLLRLYRETLCPVIPASQAEIERCWADLDAALARRLDRGAPVALDRLDRLDAVPPSLTVYHGRDERAFKARWASLFAAHRGTDAGAVAISRAPDARAADGRPHIGFVVTHGHEGVFLKCMRGILNQLPGERFRLTVVCSRQAGQDILAPAITNPAVGYLPLASGLQLAAEQVGAAGFDVLHYWEVGTDGLNYFLPFHGLAPVQCATWGWPVTSGIPEMDYYLSCERLETDESDAFYTERLVRFQHLPTFYHRPSVPAPLKSRAALGLAEHAHLYLCAQNLRKVQPDFDALVAAILRGDPAGQALFIEDAQPGITALLRRRFEHGMPDVAARIRFLPRMPEADYLNLLAVADVALDTTHYGGGANTTYDALAVGTPIVTLPGRFHRGRWAYAACRRIGVTDGIAATADGCVAIALRLGTDPEYRRDVGERIMEASPVLFEDMGAVDELAGFLEGVARG